MTDRVCVMCGRHLPPHEFASSDDFGVLCHPDDTDLPDCYRLWTVYHVKDVRDAPDSAPIGDLELLRRHDPDWRTHIGRPHGLITTADGEPIDYFGRPGTTHAEDHR